eukprot:Phypoly_transcript_09360.p1 GENE.Phypoly_transcript_09360~~Phypoly_transcript_09360.p1  ORF type:complete len:256 (+),score=33.24 Phypoly_transcript_09360:107-874(+)
METCIVNGTSEGRKNCESTNGNAYNIVELALSAARVVQDDAPSPTNYSPFSHRRKLPPCPTCQTKAVRKEKCDTFFCKKCSSSFSYPGDVHPQNENLPNYTTTHTKKDTNNSPFVKNTQLNNDANKKIAFHHRRKINNSLVQHQNYDNVKSGDPNSFQNQNYHSVKCGDASKTNFPDTHNKPWSSRRKNKRVLQAKTFNPKRNKADENNDSDTEEEDPFDAPAYSYLDALYENGWQKFHDEKLQAPTIVGILLHK